MQTAVIRRILGALTFFFSLTFLPPLLLSIMLRDGNEAAFLYAFVPTALLGLALWGPMTQRTEMDRLRRRDGFMVVVLFWLTSGLVGGLPFLLSRSPALGFTDAAFESFSGLTTTGATVLTGLDFLPLSILYYRQQLQWLGGMGLLVLAVAILPTLGVGGMQLYRAEIPGPGRDTKLAPRIAESAKILWSLYLGLTVACFGAYRLAGMDWFDAVAHSFSTVSIGGFSTHDASFSYFESDGIRLVATVFMLIAGVNFSLHVFAIRSLSLKPYLQDTEFIAYVTLQVGVLLFCILAFTPVGYWWGGADTFVTIAFQSVSIATTTGFTAAGYYDWPEYLLLSLLFASFAGACAGSVGGGLKTIRVLLLFRQGIREIARLVHPGALYQIRVGGKPLPDRIVDVIWGFFAAYTLVFVVLMLLMMISGTDQVTSFSAVVACLNNLGPGLGEVSSGYGTLGDASKWILIAAMLLGRLELFIVLALFTSTFWKN